MLPAAIYVQHNSDAAWAVALVSTGKKSLNPKKKWKKKKEHV